MEEWADQPIGEEAGPSGAPPSPERRGDVEAGPSEVPPSPEQRGDAEAGVAAGGSDVEAASAEELGEALNAGACQDWAGLENPRLARRLIRGALTDADWDRTSRQNLKEIGLEGYREVLKLAHTVSLLDDGAKSLIRSAKASAHRAREQKAAREAAEAKARELAAEGEALQHQVATLQAEGETLRQQRATWEAEGETLRQQKANWEAEGEARRLQAARLEAEAMSAQHRLAELEGRLADREARLRRRKAKTTLLASKLRDEEARAETLGEEAEAQRALVLQLTSQLEEALKQGEMRVEGAVAAYRKSAAFKEDVLEAAADLYNEGYDNCLRKVASLYPGLDLSQAETEDAEEPEGAVAAEEGGPVVIPSGGEEEAIAQGEPEPSAGETEARGENVTEAGASADAGST